MAQPDSPSDQRVALDGLTILVVEDEYYIADDVRRALTAAGAQVIGPLSSLRDAEKAASAGGFDCAVIDLNLQGESGIPVADRLIENRVPFAIATGYGSPAVPEAYRAIPRIEKPFDPRHVVSFISRLVAAPA